MVAFQMDNTYIDIERQSKDGLVRWDWRFWYYDTVLWLDYYTESQRPSRRHKFRCTERYGRLNNRGSSIKEADVVMPFDVQQEALDEFRRQVVIKRWGKQ